MSPKYFKMDIIFLLTLMILFVFVETTFVENQYKKKDLASKKGKTINKKTNSSAPNRKIVSEAVPELKYLKINNNFQIRGNITSSKVLTKNINITGQAIIAKLSTAQDINADKIGVQTIYVNEISSPNGVITISGNLVINNDITSDSSISAKSFIVKGIRQWALNHHDDFDNNTSLVGWSKNLTNNCSTSNNFLGGPCHLSYDEVSKQYENLPIHTHLRVNALLHMFDDWNGEKAFMKINNQVVWNKIGKNSPSKLGNNICGGISNDPAFALPIDIVIPHTESNLTISFGSTLKTNPCVASFGVDDVMIYVK